MIPSSTLRAKRDDAIGRATRLDLLGMDDHAKRAWARAERMTRVLDRREAERAQALDRAGAEHSHAWRERLDQVGA